MTSIKLKHANKNWQTNLLYARTALATRKVQIKIILQFAAILWNTQNSQMKNMPMEFDFKNTE